MKKLYLLITIAVLLIAGCENVLNTDDYTPALGTVRIYVGSEEENARTLQPDHNSLAGYQLTFEHFIMASPIYNDPDYVAGRTILTNNNTLNRQYLNVANYYQLYVEQGVRYFFTLRDNQQDTTLDARIQYNVYDPNRTNTSHYLVGPTGSTSSNDNWLATFSGVAIVHVISATSSNYGYFNIGFTTTPANTVPDNVQVSAEKIRTPDQISRDPVNISGKNFADVHLNDGVYTITAKAYKAGGVIGNPDDEVAAGSISNINITDGVVTSDEGKVPPIFLSASTVGSGSLDWEITLPDDYSAESYMTLYEIDGTTKITNFGDEGTLLFDGDYPNDTVSGSFPLNTGRYIAEIKLFNSNGDVANFRDVIVIWGDASTNLVFEPQNYTNPNFGLAYSGTTLSATETTFGCVAIGSTETGTGISEATAFAYTIDVPNLKNVPFNLVRDEDSLYSDISWAWNSGAIPNGIGYTTWVETDYSAKNVLWVRVISEDERTTTFYKFTLQTRVNPSVIANGGDYERTTALIFTLDSDIVNFAATDITITANGTGATRGLLTKTNDGTDGIFEYQLVINGINQSGTIGVTIPGNRYAHIISTNTFNVDVYYAEPVNLTNMEADGSFEESTTKLTLTFNKEILDLSADDIIVNSDDAQIIIGEITSIGSGVYEIDIEEVISGGLMNVSVQKAGYEIIVLIQAIRVYAVVNEAAGININLWTSEDGNILASGNNITISKTGAGGAPMYFDATVNSDYENIEWRITGYPVTVNPDGSVRIDATGFSSANYRLNVIVYKLNENIPYSTTIFFTVIY